MKILRLELAGFGPYRRQQRVDFQRFADDGIFLITGKTGAGKSSILDAICYALYNSIPRYDGGQQRLRSDYCGPDDPTWVQLDFSVGETEYRVRRTPAFERPKKNKPGELTTTASSAELFMRTGDDWEGVAAGDRNVGMEIAPIVGLTKEQFLQVILLAQNRFQAFLKAKNEERQEVLRSLFQSQRFEQIETALVERRKALEGRIAVAATAIENEAHSAGRLIGVESPPPGTDLGWLDSALEHFTVEVASATATAALADTAYATAEAEHRSLAAVATLQQRRDRAAADLARLTESSEATEIDRRALDAARRASATWPHLHAARSAAARLDQASTREEAIRATFAEIVGSADEQSAATLASAIDETTRALGSLADALTEENELAAGARALAAATAVAERATLAVTSETERVAKLPGEIAELAELVTALRVTAGGEPAVKETVDRISQQRDAAKLAMTLADKKTRAEAAELAASGADAAASTEHHSLMHRRLAGHAAELASVLVEGEPCAVCGSTEHPAPAKSDEEPVTDQDLDAARNNMDQRRAALTKARAVREEAARLWTEAVTRSADRSLAELDSALGVARSQLAEVGSARDEAAGLEGKRERLAAEIAESTAALAALATARDAAVLRAAEMRTALAVSEKRVDKQRAGFDTVAARAGSLQQTLDAANGLERAIEATGVARDAAASAQLVLRDQLAEHGFTDEGQVETARLSDVALSTLDSSIRAHEAAMATAVATLAEDDIASAPERAVDLAAAESARNDARTARDEALNRRATVTERLREATSIAGMARERLAAVAAITAEYATLRELANVVAGLEPNTRRMRLETYVLAAQLEEIVAAANARLRTMTSGRFLLEHDDSVAFRNARSGLGLSILDSHTGRSRPTHSLSGGETFLASLALALGLAEVVTNQSGGITLDTLFIDEGFGSLDGDTLEIAMSTLDSLRSGGRTIGLISHVETMKEQIEAKLRISVLDDGSSAIDG